MTDKTMDELVNRLRVLADNPMGMILLAKDTLKEAADALEAAGKEIERRDEIIGRAIINLPPELRTADPNDGIKSLRSQLSQGRKALEEAVREYVRHNIHESERRRFEVILLDFAQCLEHRHPDPQASTPCATDAGARSMPSEEEIARSICCPDGCRHEGEKSLGIDLCSAAFTYGEEAKAVLKIVSSFHSLPADPK